MKSTFKSSTFSSNTFASGTFNGVGVTVVSDRDGGGARKEHVPGPYYRDDDSPRPRKRGRDRMNDAALVVLGLEDLIGR